MSKQTIYIVVGALIIGALIYYFVFSSSGQKIKNGKYPIKAVFGTSYEGQTIRTVTSKGLAPGKTAKFYDSDDQKVASGEILDVSEKPDEVFSVARIRVDKEDAASSSYFKVKN